MHCKKIYSFVTSYIFIFLLALLFTAEAICVHRFAFLGDDHVQYNLFLTNLFLACALVFLQKFAIGICIIYQFLSSIFIISYVKAMGSPPTVTAIYHGMRLLKDTGESFINYIDYSTLIVFLLTLSIKFGILMHIHVKHFRQRAIAFSLFLLLFFSIAIPRLLVRSLTFDSRPGDFTNPIVRNITRNGYLVTWIQEIISGKYTHYADVFVKIPCSSTATRDLPDFVPGRGIVLIQVESLDYSAITARHAGLPVAPFLADLASKGICLQMDGTKRLGSANSDFEMLNSEIAAVDALYYAFRNEYPDSVIALLKSAGYDTMVFHGLYKNYMNLEKTYPKMGFKKTFFREELNAAGYQNRNNMFMKQVPDADLFEFASSHIVRDNHFVHFIITITMHGGIKEKLTENFSDNQYYDTLNYFDKALEAYVNALDDGTMIIVYGDHASYGGPEKNGNVPFILSIKNGQKVSQQFNTTFSRCEMSHYLRRIFMQARAATE